MPEQHARNRARRDKSGRFLPGASGNPAGRPALPDCLTACLRELAGEPARAGGPTRAQELAVVLWGKALGGDIRAAVLILDRLEGKPAQAVSVTADQPVSLSFADFVDQKLRARGLVRYDASPPEPNV